jgi:hypothetical protein
MIGIVDRVRQRYSLKIATALGGIFLLTLFLAVVFGLHVTNGPEETVAATPVTSGDS